MPNAVIFGPINKGGMQYPETYTLKDQVQLPYLVKQLQWDQLMANDIPNNGGN